MPDLLDRLLSEIRERLDASRDAVAEYRRLEAALAALDDSPEAPRSRPPRRRPTGRGPRADSPRKRAPRGANREAVLRIVGERPGVTTSELAAASGVQKRTLYTLLSRLTKQGVLERQELPGGQTGYRVPAAGASTQASAEKSPTPVGSSSGS